MNSTQYRQWLEKQRKELAHMYDADPLGEYSTYAAATIADEASSLAAEQRLPELMRVWAEQAEVPDVDRYLVECLAVIPEPKTVLTPPEIAEQLGAAPETVISWIKSGQLKGANLATDHRPRYVVEPDDLAKFLESRQPQPPAKRKSKAQQSGYKRFSE